ncbi:cyanoglobin [Roseivirga sp. E12]|uniref:globin domain-containing protein n=1 Tax=Roseivirga sp. E12 TaxID=2819237 RepID=UPI001ABC7752|nr:cyanoglobin [Roseivirga sp. E12]MBO3700000.1 cyanoglobin [Roseivirga sp. E12]
MAETPTLYERIGEDNILQLVDDFYEGVEGDELIRKMYPEDLLPAKNRLKLFFIQALGGHQTYTDERGHPMLRRRHFQWKIGQDEATHWLQHMHNALEKATFAEKEKDEFWDYVYKAALHMINK